MLRAKKGLFGANNFWFFVEKSKIVRPKPHFLAAEGGVFKKCMVEKVTSII